ncbi:MAG: carboxypeptidase regulatory-like domain-containing protein, partial [Pseudomonadota bacterium]
MKRTSLLLQALVCSLVLTLAACQDYLPANPYDPNARPDEQKRGEILGTLEFDLRAGMSEILRGIRVGVLGNTGGEVATVCSEAATPDVEVTCVDLDRQVRFRFGELPTDEYILTVDGVPPDYLPASVPRVTLAPGEVQDLGVLRYRAFDIPSGTQEHWTGRVLGQAQLADGEGGAARVRLYVRSSTGLGLYDETLADEAGAFGFDGIPPGTFAVAADLDGYTPDYRAGFEIQGPSVAVEQNTQSFTGSQSLILYPVTAVLIPALQQTLGHYYTRENSAPVQVLQFGGMNQMRLAAEPTFASGTQTWLDYSASTDVALPDREGTLEIYAQFRNTQVPGFTFLSRSFSTQVVRDITAPEVLAARVRGRNPGALGRVWLDQDGALLSVEIDGQDTVSAVYGMVLFHDAQNSAGDPLALSFALGESPPGLVRLDEELGLTSGEGEKKIFAYLKDRAGNVGAPGEVDVWVDTTAPVIAGLVLEGGVGVTADAEISVALQASDANGLVSMQVWEEGQAVPSPVAFNVSSTLILQPLDYANGSRQVNAVVFDVAGNASLAASQTILFDDRGSMSGLVQIEDAANGSAGDSAGVTAVVDGQTYPAQFTATANRGEYSFVVATIPAASNRQLVLQKADYADALARAPFAVVAGRATDVGVLRLQLARGSVEGFALLQGKDDHAGINVSVQGTNLSATTSDTGFFHIDGLKAGVPYILTFRRDEDWTVETRPDVVVPAATTLVLEPTVVLVPLAGSFRIAEGAYTRVARLTLLMSYDGATEYRVSETPDFAGASWNSFSNAVGPTTGYPFDLLVDATHGDGLRTIWVQFRDPAPGTGFLSDPRSDVITLDSQEPQNLSLAVNGGATYTRELAVSLTFGGTDANPIEQYQLAYRDSTSAGDVLESDWEQARTYTGQPVGVVLPGALSFRTARVWLRLIDAAGNVSAPHLASIIVDPAAPTGGHLVINSGEQLTSSFTVTLTMTASDDSAIEMLIGNDAVPATGAWQAFSASTAWVLPPATQGPKTVCVAFRDAAGNRTQDYCDDIEYDSVAPPVPAVTTTAGIYTSNPTIALDFTNTSAVATIEVATNAAFASARSYPAQAQVQYDLGDPDGTKFVFVRYLDAAGNTSAAAVLTIVLDRQAPEAVSFVIADGAYTKRLRTPLELTALGASQMKITTNADCSGGTWESFAAQGYVDLVAPDGLKDVSVQFRDQAQNPTGCLHRTTTLDRQAPVLQPTPVTLSDVKVTVTGGSVISSITVRLDLDVEVADAYEMKLSNQDGLPDASWEPFRAYVTDWPVSPTEGSKTVYAMLRDRAGNTTTQFSGSLFVRTKGDITGTVTQESSSDTTGLSFYLDGNPVTPTFSGNRFTIADVLVKFYSSLLLQKVGYDSRSVTGIQVQPASAVDVGSVSLLLSRGNIEGYAKLADMSTHENIFVEVLNTGYNARTNSEGYFYIEKVLVGTYDLRAGKDGYSSQSATGLVVTTGATTPASTNLLPLLLPVLSGDFSINNNAAYTSGTTVHLNLSQAGATQYRVSESLSLFSDPDTGWVGYPGDGDYDFTLETTDQGTHTIYVQFKVGGTATEVYESSIILDTTAPARGSIELAGGATAVNVLAVSVTVGSSDTNGISKMAFSTNGSTFAPPVTFQNPYTYTFTGGEGTKRLYVQYIDPAGNRSSLPAVSDDILYDVTLPTGSIVIVNASGIAYPGNTTRSNAVYVRVASTDGLEMKLSNSSGFPGVTWRPYDGSLIPWNLDGGDGPRAVYVALKDRAGNVAQGTAGLDASITVDSTAPVAPVFNITQGAYTGGRTIQLNFSNSNQAATVHFASNRELGVVQEETAATSLTFDLPDVDGLHLLTLTYLDVAGNESQPSSASITLDRDFPKVLGFSVEGTGYTKAASVTLLLEASGASEMRFSNTTSFSSAWEPYQSRRQAWSINTTGQGPKSIYVQVRDLALNETAGASPATVTYDTLPPAGTLVLAGGQAVVNTPSIVVEVTGASSDTTGIAVGDAALDCESTAYLGFVPRLDYTLPVANGPNTVKVCLRDEARNTTPLSGLVNHDDVKPQIAVLAPENTNHADGRVPVTVTVSGETQNVNVTLSSPAASAPVIFTIVPASDPTGNGSISLTPAAGGAPDGSVLLTVEARDQAGNLTTVNRIVLVDREKPGLDALGCASCIDTGSALLSTSAAISLAVTASGASEMRITGNVTSSTAWQPFVALIGATLSSTAGNKTVNVELRDAVGNLSSPTLRTLTINL